MLDLEKGKNLFENFVITTHDLFPAMLIAPVNFKRKNRTMHRCGDFTWNVFDLFQPNVPFMKKAVFP